MEEIPACRSDAAIEDLLEREALRNNASLSASAPNPKRLIKEMRNSPAEAAKGLIRRRMNKFRPEEKRKCAARQT